MAAERSNKKPWNTPDFELKFREAMGRDMTHQEREFFGLSDDESGSNGESGPSGSHTSERTQFAWQSLRRISALLG